VTFSVVGRSPDGDSLGVAVASKFLAVGSAVPAARFGLGALATQSYANTLYKRDGLALLDAGRTAQQTLDALLAADDDRETRQAGVVDAAGRAATFTGAECLDWAGGVAGTGYAIQGNILAGPQVVDAMLDAWTGGADVPLPERLIATLAAGEAAGGDRRGRQSAALLVVAKGMGYGGTSDVVVDLRVDDHPDPVGELARLMALHSLYFERPDPKTLIALDGAAAAEVRARLAGAGHPSGPAAADLDEALASWAGIANLEERIVPGAIDPLVLEQLRAATPAPSSPAP
jgi:uncharacterized Ntn-hydrolase superfamily protein